MGCGGSKTETAPEPKNENNAAETNAVPKLDSRLPFTNYRDFYSFKNYWKTIKRNDVECGKNMFAG
jgi:hypothetical protein